MMKSNRAITLISLIITIIVLLILAGVAINMMLGENGLFNKAKSSVSKYENEQEKENSILKRYEANIDENIKIAGIREEQELIKKMEETTQVTNISYKSEAQEFIAPEDGYYKIECWGAQGGMVYDTAGGKGAYTKGIIKLKKDEKLYIYTGECYNGVKTEKSFNGGGTSVVDTRPDCLAMGANGGGATDIRLIAGDWNDFNSLKSRIMVAAGGGGAYGNIVGWRKGGTPAGALKGRSGDLTVYQNHGYNLTATVATGANQTSSGEAAIMYSNGSEYGRTDTMGEFRSWRRWPKC